MTNLIDEFGIGVWDGPKGGDKPMTPRVYVAGAYSADNLLVGFDNMRRGLRLVCELHELGFAPYSPWEDSLRHLMSRNGLTIESSYAASMKWLEVSEAMLVQPVRAEGSYGLKQELRRAKELAIPIFRDVETLLKWRDEQAANL